MVPVGRGRWRAARGDWGEGGRGRGGEGGVRLPGMGWAACRPCVSFLLLGASVEVLRCLGAAV